MDAQNKVNGFRVQSASIVDRARDLDVPDEASQAQRYLLETLEFRRDGLAKIAEDLPDALGDESRRQGSEGVARQMQVFLASDVIYAGRYKPGLEKVLRTRTSPASRPGERLHTGHRMAAAELCGGCHQWLRTGEPGDQETTGGLHGNGLVGVALGGCAGARRLGDRPAGRDLTFEVQVANQGDSTETDVGVKVTVGEGADATGRGHDGHDRRGRDQVGGDQARGAPATGQNVPIRVE